MEKEITIDTLYDLMRAYVRHDQMEPNYILINPLDSYKMEEEFIKKFGYNHANQNGKLTFRGVKFIRSNDVEVGKPIFVK